MKCDIKIKKFISHTVMISCFFVLSATSAVALPAFPGAEGYGANTVGGRGGRVIEVTNLNDSGPGSFREACESSGPRIVVFRTGGTIKLNSDIKIKNPYITIAGQTAPGDGITLRAGSLIIRNTHDVIVRGLRMRLGRENGDAKDAFASVNGDGINSNLIVDHCSISWGTDENISTYGDNHNITFQWCIISEGLMPHSMGLRVGKAGYHSVSIHHNLFAHNNARSPQLSYGSKTEVVNNVVYNWASRATSVKADSRTNIIGNYYKAGPSTGNNDDKMIYFFNTDNPMAYLNGNVGPGRPSSNSGDDWNLVSGGLQSMRSFSPVVPQSGIATQKAEEVFDLVLNNAGAISPRRDSVDLRIIQSVINNSGGMINDPGEVGGWPVLNSGTPLQDTDHDGMPDNWEIAQRLNPNDQTDGNGDQDGDGYTNIEEYINGLIPVIEVVGTLDTEEPAIPTNLTALAASSSQVNLSWNASTDNVGVIGYRIYRNGNQIASTTSTIYQDTGLSPSTTYTYAVSAYDAAGNESLQSDMASTTSQDFVSFSQLFEAERMNLLSPMATGIDNNASGGQYISPTSGTNSTTPVPEATINFTIPQTGSYYLWICIMGTDPGSDALYVGIDTTWDRVYPGTTNIYEWVRIETSNNSGNYNFNLTQGTYTLRIGHGEINSRADALFLTSDPNEIPTINDTSPPAPPVGLGFIVQ